VNPDTYLVVYTVDGDFASIAEIVDVALAMDAPTEVPTIAELRDRIQKAVRTANYAARHANELNQPRSPAYAALVDRIVEIVTLGNVPAGGES
jgi:hypothetical protein